MPINVGRPSGRLIVAIDGPAAAGKTTVGKLLADRLDASFLDTGVLYRALTLAALERGVDVANADGLAAIARSLDVRVARREEEGGTVDAILLDDRDISDAIRSPEVDGSVSQVAGHAAVRAALVDAQRRAAAAPRAVVVGRDIGTVIFPDAQVKVFLDASAEERVRRRSAERATGEQATVERQLAERDRLDRERAVAPLVPAPDALVLDTDGLSIEEVVQHVERLVAGVLK
jgi:cytidylate kinase